MPPPRRRRHPPSPRRSPSPRHRHRRHRVRAATLRAVGAPRPPPGQRRSGCAVSVLVSFPCCNLIGRLRERKGFSCLCHSRETHERHCRYAVPCRKLLEERERRIYSDCCTYKIFSLTHSGCQRQVAKGVAGVSAAKRWWRHQQVEATLQQGGRAARWCGRPPAGRKAIGQESQREWAPAARDAGGDACQ